MKIYKFYYKNLPKKGLIGNGLLLVASKNKTQAKEIAKKSSARWDFAGEIKKLSSDVGVPQIVEELRHDE